MSADTLIAVAGTLTAGGVTSWWHARTVRVERRDRRDAQRREELLTAVADLVAALDAHRAAMWVRETTRLSGDPADVPATVDRAHQTRAAVSAPLVRVRILAPGLATAASSATQATYAMHDAPTTNFLDRQRQASLDAIARLETAAAAQLRVVS
jgi:hypothetical protein